MDPQQTWLEMLEALQCEQWQEVADLAHSLCQWLDQGGFPPVTVGDQCLGSAWHRAVTVCVCRIAVWTASDNSAAVRTPELQASPASQRCGVFLKACSQGDRAVLVTHCIPAGHGMLIQQHVTWTACLLRPSKP
jgi:hypothetical protein